MKTKKYKDLLPNLKRLVLLKYFQDPIGSIIKLKYPPSKSEYLAIEIWTGTSNLLVIVEPQVLSSLQWDNKAIEDEDDEFIGDYQDDFNEEMKGNFYS
ncbi:MAG: hypothetical protein ACI857_001208 [Arenicella sp.]|jgi:hypothetical protein